MEKIKHIEISNFKSIKHLEINDCNTINVFIGKPNAGKSNVLEGISLYCYLEQKLSFEIFKNFIRHSTVNDLFFEGNINNEFSVKVNNSSIVASRIFNNLNFKFTESEISGEQFINYDYEEKKRNTNGFDLTTNIKSYVYDTKVNYKTTSYFKGEKHNNLKAPKGENLADIISTNPSLRSDVNEIFNQNNIKLLIDRSTNRLKIFKEYQDGTAFTLPYDMIADTLKRLIFYKSAIMSNEKSVLLFEEPEAHCFEPYILEFTNDVKYDKNDNQFFIVTHNDFIIKEFLRDEESKHNTNIYLVNNVNGETEVKLLDKNKNEDVFEYGMNIFFNFESLWETN